jgi:hypothetical protein
MNDGDEILVKQWLTIPGRLLLLVVIVGTVSVLLWWLMHTLPELPAGSYPIALWLVPAVLFGSLVFGTSSWLLEALGVRVFRRQSSDQRHDQDSAAK